QLPKRLEVSFQHGLIAQMIVARPSHVGYNEKPTAFHHEACPNDTRPVPVPLVLDDISPADLVRARASPRDGMRCKVFQETRSSRSQGKPESRPIWHSRWIAQWAGEAEPSGSVRPPGLRQFPAWQSRAGRRGSPANPISAV